MMRYRNGFDRQIGMYFAFLIVALVGAGAAFAILAAINNTEWESDGIHAGLIDDPMGAEIPGNRQERR